MKRIVLVLLALVSLIPGAQLLAQAPPAAAPAASAPAAPAPDLAQFLATLPGAKPQAPSDSAPAPLFMTGCATKCAYGEICCFLCGTLPEDGDTSGCWGCTTPIKGRCPQPY